MPRTIQIPVRSLALLAVGAALALGVARSGGQTTPPAAGATPTGACKTGVVDLVRIFNETAQILDLNDLINQKKEEYAKEGKQRQKVIEDKQMELTAFKPGTPDYETRRKNLVRLSMEANVWLKVAEQEMEQQRFDWTKVVYEKGAQTACDIAKERGFELVVQKTEWKPFEIEQNLQTLRRVIQDRTVICYSPECDVTDQVIQRMNAAYKAAGGKTTLTAGSAPTAPPAKP